MQNYLVPKPIGNEIININNGEKFTYKEIMCLKNKIELVITNAQQKIQNNDINNENLVYFTIMHEYYKYNNLIQPINLISFFHYVIDLYYQMYSLGKEIKSLKPEQFEDLHHCKYSQCFNLMKNSKMEIPDKCSICLNRYKKSSNVTFLKCKHIFHKKCLSKWLLKCSNSCPMCKKIIN